MSHFLRRSSMNALCLFVAGAIGMSLVAQTGGPIKVINVDGKPAGPVSSSGILTGNTLYVSAQDGRNADGAVPADFQQEVSQSLSNVQSVLRAAGMDFGNATWMIVYLVHTADIDKMNEVYWKMIGANPPARTILVVGALPNGENIQINCIAVSRAAKRQVIHPQGWPQGPQIDPPGTQADDVLYISAQGGADPATGKIPEDPTAEVKQALDNVAAVLKAANMTMANVVWVNPFLDANQGVMNQVYATYFEFGNTPGRGTTQVVDLPDRKHVVFSVIAGADIAKRKSVQTINMAPSPTASPGVLYDDTLYLSGKSGSWEMPVGGGGGARGRRGVGAAGGGAAARGGRGGGGGEAMPDLDTQVHLSLRNLYDGLVVANMTFASVVSYTDYLRDINDANQVQNVVANYWAKDHIPARTTFQETLNTTTGGSEQISFIAVRQPQP